MKAPPFQLTENILTSAMSIAELLGALGPIKASGAPPLALRKVNQIRSIHSSLAIEGNTLSLEQMTAILNQLPVVGPPKDILEVQNAIFVYNKMSNWLPHSEKEFKLAHRFLMKGLMDNPGEYRQSNVGVFAGSQIAHVAPGAKQVPRLMSDLFAYIKAKDSISILIKACIFHYELEFIHPFSDGNGRMGRLWQQVILKSFHPVFSFLPIETLIKENQKGYYAVLSDCDAAGESTAFIEFSLDLIWKALKAYQLALVYQPQNTQTRLAWAQTHFDSWFSRKDYLQLQKDISSATASRDLREGVSSGVLEKQHDKRLTQYRFIKILRE